MTSISALAGTDGRGSVTAGADRGATVWREMLEARMAARDAAERASREAARTALEAKKRAAAAAAARERAAKLAKKKAAEARQRAAARRAALAKAYSLPVFGYHLTARFSAGGGLWAGGHTGLDFAAPTGTPVRAVEQGRIVEAGWAGAYGNRLIVRHPDGTETWYCHLSRFGPTGGAVVAGQIIGGVGSTGNVTGPHLHFEVHPGGGGPIDPYTWLASHGHRP